MSAGSQYLVITDFDVALPAGATINLLRVNVDDQSDPDTVIDVYLTKDGVNTVGTPQGYMGGNPAVWQLGGNVSVWGTTLTKAEVEASTFGLMILGYNTNQFNQRSIAIDAVSIEVGYETAGGTVVRGITLSGVSANTITVGRVAAASTVRGVTVVASGAAPVTVGRRAAATTVRGITVAASGSVGVTVGRVAAASTARGVTVVASGAAPVTIGRRAAATTVRGVTVVASGSAPVTAGRVAAATIVRGVTPTGTGSATVQIGRVVRRNLIPNSGAETNLNDTNHDGSVSLSRITDDVLFGSGAFRGVTQPTFAGGGGYQVYLYQGAKMPVTAGETYAASAYAKVEANGRNGLVVFLFYDSGGSSVGSSTGPNVALSNGVWTRYSHTAVAPAGAASCWVLFYVRYPASGEVVKWDGLQLEPGAVSAYNPTDGAATSGSVVRGITLVGLSVAPVGRVAATSTVRGITLVAGATTVTIGRVAAASTVRGITVVATGAAPVTVGRVAAATAVRGITVVGSGTVTLTIGRRAAASTVRGVTVVASGAATVTVGRAAVTPTVRGITVTGSGSVNVPLGRVAAASTVRGVTVTAGASTVTVGRVAATSTTRGITVVASGAAPVTVGRVAASSTVRGVTVVGLSVVQIGRVAGAAKNLLLVVGSAATPTTGDALLRGWLEDLGFTVTYRSDDDADSVTGYDGVVISESVASATIAAKYDTVAVPVVTHEGLNADELRLATATDNPTTTHNEITIENASHPIANGPHGTFPAGVDTLIYTTTTRISRAEGLPAGAVAVANEVEDGAGLTSKKRIIAAEAGATLTSGTAPARRVFFALNDAGASLLNADGVALLKNAYTWAFGGASSGTVVRGITVVSGGMTVQVGRVAASSTTRGVTVVAAGTATLPVGRRAAAATVRGVTLQPGTLTVPVGRVNATSTVRGVTPVPAPSLLPVGHRSSTTLVRGMTLSPGPVTVTVGRRLASTTVRGLVVNEVFIPTTRRKLKVTASATANVTVDVADSAEANVTVEVADAPVVVSEVVDDRSVQITLSEAARVTATPRP